MRDGDAAADWVGGPSVPVVWCRAGFVWWDATGTFSKYLFLSGMVCTYIADLFYNILSLLNYSIEKTGPGTMSRIVGSRFYMDEGPKRQ